MLNRKLASCSTGGVVWLSKCHPLPTLPIEGIFLNNILMSEWKGAWFYEGWLRHWGLIVLIQIGSAAGMSGRPNRLWVREGRTACWWLHTVTEHLLSYSFDWKIALTNIKYVSQYAWRVFSPCTSVLDRLSQ